MTENIGINNSLKHKIMKKTLILLFCFPLLSYAQHSDRVLLIKKMYKETRSYEKEGDCKTISWLSISDVLDKGIVEITMESFETTVSPFLK